MTHLHNGTLVQQKGDQAAATHNITRKALKLCWATISQAQTCKASTHSGRTANGHVWEANRSAGALPADSQSSSFLETKQRRGWQAHSAIPPPAELLCNPRPAHPPRGTIQSSDTILAAGAAKGLHRAHISRQAVLHMNTGHLAHQSHWG